MKPAAFQKMASFLNTGQEELGLDCRLSASKVMYCEKCGFVSADAAAFRKHMLEHMATRFYCFYCNHASQSETELHAHLKQHTVAYPHKCQYCGQGYMRRDYLVNHIQRLHGKSIDQGPSKPVVTEISHPPVAPTLPRAPRGDVLPQPPPQPPPPRIQIKIPPTTLPPARVDKARQKGKTVDTNVSNVAKVAKVEAELLSPLNEPIRHNRALTVSLPEEVTIPAGCLVELIEVKTVNGTKELKLRLVSQQENESLVKDNRNPVSQNTALGKTLSSALNNNSNTAKPGGVGLCTINRKVCETRNLIVERPAVVLTKPAKSIPNPACQGPRGTKRKLQETIIDLSVEHPTFAPAKVAKSIPNSATKGTCGIKIMVQETLTAKAARPTIVPTASPSVTVPNPAINGWCLPNRTLHETKKQTKGHCPSLPTVNVSYPKSIQNMQVALNDKLREASTKGNATPVMNKQVVRNNYSVQNRHEKLVVKNMYSGQNQQSRMSALSASSASHVLTTTNIQGTPSALSVCKGQATADQSSLMPNTGYSTLTYLLSTKQPKVDGGASLTNSKTSAWTQSGRGNERPFEGNMFEPKGFPVISSVFSLSQQPEDSQGCVPPLVLALRAMVSKGTSSVKTSSGHAKTLLGQKEGKGTPMNCVQVAKEGMYMTHTPQPTQKAGANPHFRHTQMVTGTPSDIKDGKNGVTANGNEKCRKMSGPYYPPASVQHEVVSTITSQADVPVAEGLPRQLHSSAEEQDDSSKFLTVCLKRVGKVGLWKQDKRKRNNVSKSKTLSQAEARGIAALPTAVLPTAVLPTAALPTAALPTAALPTAVLPTAALPTAALPTAALPTAPLKVDQLVKRAGPNQPVVVLNHPKPRVPKSDTDTGPPDVVPKCQILKMRLSKGVGQKYEVVGCTVKVLSYSDNV